MNDTRHVRLLLASASGRLVGTLPDFEVSTPWWPEVREIGEIAAAHFGVRILVLRILTTDAPPEEMGGDVTYLAEIVGELPPSAPIHPVEADADMSDHPLRMSWARPGGIAATIAWADRALQAIGRPRIGEAVQVKTWNLSSIVLLPTDEGDVWCKSLPPFCTRESTIIGLVGAEVPTLVPPLLASDEASSTSLLGNVPGEDQWDAGEDLLIAMVRTFVALQSRFGSRVGDLLSAGLPDRRAEALPPLVEALLRRADVVGQLDDAERRALFGLVGGLGRRLARLAECGLPETLVHGDFHPGNWRSDGGSAVLLDWGDSCIGHPMFDMSAFLPRVPEPARSRVRSAWFDAWRAERPDADPERASDLIAPVAALRSALVYRGFLDGIEPDERRYHEADVPLWLRRAVTTAADAASHA